MRKDASPEPGVPSGKAPSRQALKERRSHFIDQRKKNGILRNACPGSARLLPGPGRHGVSQCFLQFLRGTPALGTPGSGLAPVAMAPANVFCNSSEERLPWERQAPYWLRRLLRVLIFSKILQSIWTYRPICHGCKMRKEASTEPGVPRGGVLRGGRPFNAYRERALPPGTPGSVLASLGTPGSGLASFRVLQL